MSGTCAPVTTAAGVAFPEGVALLHGMLEGGVDVVAGAVGAHGHTAGQARSPLPAICQAEAALGGGHPHCTVVAPLIFRQHAVLHSTSPLDTLIALAQL